MRNVSSASSRSANLLAADRSKKVRDVMRTDFVFVSEDEDKEVVAQLLSQASPASLLPVLDHQCRMLGIVSSTDLAGVVQQDASEDILKIGGMEALEGPYMEVTFAQMVRKRAGWLAILFLGEMLTATAMGYFSDEISRAVVLALFIPLIISSGGNSGSQATTLVIRAMALGEIRLRDWWRVIRRELMAGVTLGAILGTDRRYQNSSLARSARNLRRALSGDRPHDRLQPDWRGDVWDARRLDVAVYFA